VPERESECARQREGKKETGRWREIERAIESEREQGGRRERFAE